MWTFESLGTGMPSKIAAFVKAAELEQMVLMCPKQHLEWYTQESSTRLCILFPADFNAQEKNTRDCFRHKIIQNLHNASTRYGLTRTGSWNFQQTHPTQSVPIVATCLGKANSGTRSVCFATWHSGCKAYISQTPPNSSKSADPLCCQDAKSQIQTSQTEIQNPKANLRFGCFPSASALCNFVQLIPPRSIKSFGNSERFLKIGTLAQLLDFGTHLPGTWKSEAVSWFWDGNKNAHATRTSGTLILTHVFWLFTAIIPHSSDVFYLFPTFQRRCKKTVIPSGFERAVAVRSSKKKGA